MSQQASKARTQAQCTQVSLISRLWFPLRKRDSANTRPERKTPAPHLPTHFKISPPSSHIPLKAFLIKKIKEQRGEEGKKRVHLISSAEVLLLALCCTTSAWIKILLLPGPFSANEAQNPEVVNEYAAILFFFQNQHNDAWHRCTLTMINLESSHWLITLIFTFTHLTQRKGKSSCWKYLSLHFPDILCCPFLLF